jgi:hypothetical protein
MALDADCLVDMLILHMSHKSSSDQLLKVKNHATKKEISIATQKVGLILSP